MSEREDYDRLADKLGNEADQMQQENERLEEELDDVRHEWEQKRADERVPGAPPRDDDEETSDSESAGE